MSNVVLIFVLLAMIYCHIFDDYFIQGILASMKQKSWWKKQKYDEDMDPKLYKHDYIMALIEHAFSWTFSMMLIPSIIFIYYHKMPIYWIIAFLINWIVHIVTDNAKANNHSINLITDQCIHFAQIIWTFCVFVQYMK